MSYNKYNTRNSTGGRFNTPGQFVPAAAEQQIYGSNPPAPPAPIRKPTQQQLQQNLQQQVTSNLHAIQTTDIEMKVEDGASNDDTAAGSGRPPWLKNKLAGVKKVSTKERRRRQNETLRRLLTPKNALMVLNEMLPGEQLANQFKVEAANPYYNKQHSFCADLTIAGHTYKGFGENKLTARNAAAEQAIRDLIIKRMNKVLSGDAAAAAAGANANANSTANSLAKAEGGEGGEGGEEEALPMIQLASFALHKLFSEWEYEGHKVPQLKPSQHTISESTSEPGGTMTLPPRPRPPKPPKQLPLNAGQMHPSMLLAYMRPHLEYRELAVEGDTPQTITFTLGVDVDGATYVGKASNKKEARKQAAKAACTALFNVQFDEVPTAQRPLVPQE